MNNDIEKILFDQAQLDKRMDEMAAELNQKYEGKQPIVIPVLNGAMIFASDMIKRLNFKLTVDPIKASSYAGTESTGKVKITQDIKSDVKDQPVIFMEDIIDTGRTLQYLINLLKVRKAASIKICSLLDKPSRRIMTDVIVDYVGVKVPNEFVVGYGLDYEQKYRNLPYIGVLKESIYS